jgi:hypothetical protein
VKTVANLHPTFPRHPPRTFLSHTAGRSLQRHRGGFRDPIDMVVNSRLYMASTVIDYCTAVVGYGAVGGKPDRFVPIDVAEEGPRVDHTMSLRRGYRNENYS